MAEAMHHDVMDYQSSGDSSGKELNPGSQNETAPAYGDQYGTPAKDNIKVKVEETPRPTGGSLQSGLSEGSQPTSTGLKWGYLRREQPTQSKAYHPANPSSPYDSVDSAYEKSGQSQRSKNESKRHSHHRIIQSAEEKWRRTFYKSLPIKESGVRGKLSTAFGALRKSSTWSNMSDDDQIIADQRAAIVVLEKWLRDQEKDINANKTSKGFESSDTTADTAKIADLLAGIKDREAEEAKRAAKQRAKANVATARERQKIRNTKRLDFEAGGRNYVFKTSPSGWKKDNLSDCSLDD